MKTAEVMVCKHCGSDEFAGRAAAWDIVRFVDGQPRLVRTEADDFAPDEFFCNECWAQVKINR